MNYTKPNDPDHQDTPKDWLRSSLIFVRALSLILKETEGIVVKISGDAKDLTEYDKVIVYRGNDKMVHVINCEDDLPEGQLVWMHPDEE